MISLFEHGVNRPLADKLRPTNLEEVVGQEHLLGESGPLTRMVRSKQITSFILWGPPGTGKTTIGRLLASSADLLFMSISAMVSGVSDLRKVFNEAKRNRQNGHGTLLFVDEIHRFNRSQQDSFLPYLEDGTVILVGATTENPSFELNPAILSRTQVLVVKRLHDDALEELLMRAEEFIGRSIPVDLNARNALRHLADGDGRYLLNLVEALFAIPDKSILNREGLANLIQKRVPLYDKSQDSHYNLISALHKSLRGSDTSAALYWLARMLLAGESPNYIMRRLTRFAIEDIGLADPNALTQAIASWQAYERIGSPEGELAIVQCVIYLGTAPKSNSVYEAEKAARKSARETGSLMPPKHILNSSTEMMEDMGYGEGYIYDHNLEQKFSGQHYFPENMDRENLYNPGSRGFEREIVKRLEYWDKLRKGKGPS